jgi:hypothetical protein
MRNKIIKQSMAIESREKKKPSAKISVSAEMKKTSKA